MRFAWRIVAAHLALGVSTAGADVQIQVSGSGTEEENGQGVQAALSEARAAYAAAPGPIEVRLAPGRYWLARTLVLDVPGLTLEGSNCPDIDDDGWPTGVVDHESLITVTYGVNDAQRIGTPMVKITASNVTVAAITFDAGRASSAVLGDNAIDVYGVDGFTVRDSRFFGWAGWGIITNRASGRIVGNHAAGISVAVGVHAGPTNQRSRLTIEDNRLVANAGGGLLINSTTLLPPGSAAPTEAIDGSIEAVVRHNDLSENVLSAFFSFGLRVMMHPPDDPIPGDNRVKLTVSGNRIHGNEVGVVFDAGFSTRTLPNPAGGPSPWVCDPRTFTGRIHAHFDGNSIVPGSVGPRTMIPTLITFTRGTTAINRFGRTPILPRPGVPISYKFMQKAHYVIVDADDDLAGVRIDHPAVDPLPAAQDPCGFGGTTLKNVLTINDVEIANTP